MSNIIEKCKSTRILGVIGIAGLILGTILPYIKIKIFSYTYKITLFEYWEGKVVLALAIANLLIIFKDIVETYIPSLFNTGIGQKIQESNSAKTSLIPTILSAGFTIYLTSTLDKLGFEYFNIGFYAMWIGTISLVAYAFLHRQEDV